MATKEAIVSFRVADENGRVKAVEHYVTFDDTDTLSTLAASVATLCGALDDVTDGVILSQSIKIYLPLPTSGIKTSAVAGSDVEETGLFTFITSAAGGKLFSVDIPAVAQAILVGRAIPVGSAGAAKTYADMVINPATTFRHTDNRWAVTLDTTKEANKTFRKSR